MSTAAPLTESVIGNVIRQLYHGKPYLVFVQHARNGKPRAVFMVRHAGGGGYVPTDHKRMDWQHDFIEPEMDELNIAAEYLRQALKHL